MDVIPAAFFGVLALSIGLYSLSIRQGSSAWWMLAGFIALLVIVATLAGHSWTSVLLLDGAELLAVALVWLRGTQEAASAARRYLWCIVPAIAFTLAGLAIIGSGSEVPSPVLQKAAVCLLVIGFALKLGLVPFYFWLPAVAASASTMSAVVVIALVDIATFAELAGLRGMAPWVFGEYAPVWAALAVVSLIGASLLALAQRDLKRMLAFSSIHDLGLLLLGVVAGGLGLSGAWIGALNHALCKVVLFGAVGLAEERIGRPVTLETRGLATTAPLAAAAFIIAGFGMIGVPPGFGFTGYWRLYTAGAQLGGSGLLAILIVVAALDLLCYARAIHRTWFGTTQLMPITPRPANLAAAVLTCLAVAEVVLGLWPYALTGLGSPFDGIAMLR